MLMMDFEDSLCLWQFYCRCRWPILYIFNQNLKMIMVLNQHGLRPDCSLCSDSESFKATSWRKEMLQLWEYHAIYWPRYKWIMSRIFEIIRTIIEISKPTHTMMRNNTFPRKNWNGVKKRTTATFNAKSTLNYLNIFSRPPN